MPIYEYYCECGAEREARLSFQDADQLQTCGCGKTMQRQVSACSFVMKQTGKGMALDTLNSNMVGGKRKAWAKSCAAQGL